MKLSAAQIFLGLVALLGGFVLAKKMQTFASRILFAAPGVLFAGLIL